MRAVDASGRVRDSETAYDDEVFFDSGDSCPQRPTSIDADSIGFERQGFVRWLHPVELVRAGLRALLAGLFGAYADKRELQAAIREQPVFSYVPEAWDGQDADDDDLWIDFAADVGDGFNATYAVARLIAEPSLTVAGQTTQRGKIFILGGDEVYPSATAANYAHRMRGPYRAALPYTPEDHPHLYAIPGNHDWYDGLTAFLRLFTQNRWVGGWRTLQSRSYFALRLTRRYWLWGIDIQLSTDMDAPQIQYFRAVSEQVQPGDRVILCTAEPSWVKAQEGRPAGYKSLSVFQEQLIRERGAEAVLVLTGDSHHYCRYARKDGQQQYVTAGGGGAFLHATHRLPEELRFARVSSQGARNAPTEEVFEQQHVFPSARESRGYRTRLMLFPFYNYGFVALWTAVWFLLTWTLQSATLATGAASRDGSFLQEVADARGVRAVAMTLWDACLHSPTSLLTLGLLILAAYAYADAKSRWTRLFAGLAHIIVHVGAWLALLNVAGTLASPMLQLLVSTAGAGFVSACVFGIYSWLTGHFSNHALDIVFSGFGIQDYKNFLRLHLSRSGDLTVYPMGLRKVPRAWQLAPSPANDAAAWIEPEHGKIADLAELIEPPLVLRADATSWQTGAENAVDARELDAR
jgi:hypothetical protein